MLDLCVSSYSCTVSLDTSLNEYSRTIMVVYKNLSREGFKQPLIDDTSYEENSLSTKPTRPDLIWVKKGKKKLEERLKICSKLDFHYSVVAVYRVSNCITKKTFFLLPTVSGKRDNKDWSTAGLKHNGMLRHILGGAAMFLFSPDLNYCPTCKPELLRQWFKEEEKSCSSFSREAWHIWNYLR